MKYPHMRILFVELKWEVRQQARLGPCITRDLSHVVGVLIRSPVNLGTEAGIYVLSADKRTGQSRFTMTLQAMAPNAFSLQDPFRAMRRNRLRWLSRKVRGKLPGHMMQL
jgi:hypothetical protein